MCGGCGRDVGGTWEGCVRDLLGLDMLLLCYVTVLSYHGHTCTASVQVLSKQYSHFAGEEVLRRQEQVQVLSHLVESWADQALAIFRRHCPLEAAIKPADSKVGVVVPPTGGSSKEEQSSSDLLLANSASLPKTELVQSSSPTGCSKEDEARAMMTELNRSITAFLLDLGNQVTGENGVASVLLRVGTPVEAWLVPAYSYITMLWRVWEVHPALLLWSFPSRSQKFKLISRSQDKRIAFSDQKKYVVVFPYTVYWLTSDPFPQIPL